MADLVKIPPMRPEPTRDRSGKYVLPDPQDGLTRSWTRATTIAHTLDDDYHLTQWKRRMVLQGLATQPNLLEGVAERAAALAEAGDDWRTAKGLKRELDAVCDSAAEAAGAGEGAKLGTLLHTVTEYYDAGRYSEIEHLVPDLLKRDLEAYAICMADAGITCPPEYIERIVVNSRVDAAGTFDRLVRLPDGRLPVGDLKTQKSMDFGFMSIAIQLAEYANADAMLDDETGQLVPMPTDLDHSIGIVMHLPVGQATCTLYELDLLEGWCDALAAHDVRLRRARSKSLGRVYVPRKSLSTNNTSVDQDLYLINNAAHPDALVALWRDLSARGCWTELHTQTAAARKAQLANATTS